MPCLKKVLISECPKLKKLPFSKERAYYFDLHAHNEEWFERLEWEVGVSIGWATHGLTHSKQTWVGDGHTHIINGPIGLKTNLPMG